MAISTTPRSVADATRFTPTTPHANSKSSASASPAPSSSSTPSSSSRTPASPSSRSATVPPSGARAPPPRRPGAAGSFPGRPGAPGGGGGPPLETPEEKVKRLRAAHLAARNAETSGFDKVVSWSRRWMDSAHRITVMGLIGFSGIALLATVYATVDMAQHNRKRRADFLEMQKRVAADSLEAARLAYIGGNATEEQIELVEEAEARARAGGFKLPSLLSAPREINKTEGGTSAAAEGSSSGGRTLNFGESMTEANLDAAKEVDGKQKSRGIREWLFGGLKTEDTAASAAGSSGTPTNATSSSLKDKAKAAFEQEKDHQRQGGLLDQVGIPAAASETAKQPEKKGWW